MPSFNGIGAGWPLASRLLSLGSFQQRDAAAQGVGMHRWPFSRRWERWVSRSRGGNASFPPIQYDSHGRIQPWTQTASGATSLAPGACMVVGYSAHDNGILGQPGPGWAILWLEQGTRVAVLEPEFPGRASSHCEPKLVVNVRASVPATVDANEAIYVTELGWNATAGDFFHFRREALQDCSGDAWAPGTVMSPAACTSRYVDGVPVLSPTTWAVRVSSAYNARWLHVFSGSPANPTFLCAFDNTGGAVGSSGCLPDAGGSGWRRTECVSSTSPKQHFTALPPGLTAGADALSLDTNPAGIWAYWPSDSAIVVGTKAQLRRAIAEPRHWSSRPVGDHLQHMPYNAGWTIAAAPSSAPPSAADRVPLGAWVVVATTIGCVVLLAWLRRHRLRMPLGLSRTAADVEMMGIATMSAPQPALPSDSSRDGAQGGAQTK